MLQSFKRVKRALCVLAFMAFCGLGVACVDEPDTLPCGERNNECPAGFTCWKSLICIKTSTEGGGSLEDGGVQDTRPPEAKIEQGCGVGLVWCSGSCVDVSRNSEHCDGCGKRCPATQVCAANVCLDPVP